MADMWSGEQHNLQGSIYWKIPPKNISQYYFGGGGEMKREDKKGGNVREK
jgi:hypothetical protein